MATFYYDESNNHRKLWIDPERRAYNIEKDTQRKVPVGRNFVLGGVAHYGETSTADFSALIESLSLDKSVNEVKFKNIAKGDFDACLKSERIGPLLSWLIESDLYLHFFSINIEYWAFIDIIDDCLIWCHESGAQFELRSMDEPDQFKDALYSVIRMDRTSFLDLAHSFSYPDLEGKTSSFIDAIAKHLKSVLISPEHEEQLEEVGLRDAIERLWQLFNASAGITEMTLVQEKGEDGQEPMLIDAFTPFFDYTVMSRSQDNLIMDMEAKVKECFDKIPERLTGAVSFRFVDSKEEPLVRVSDMITGLVARCLQFVDDHDHQYLAEWHESLNKWQRQNLSLLKQLIDKSDDRDPMLLHRVVADAEKSKFMLILYPEYFHAFS
ncbi:DUF3800 domain-containing protein [Xanthomonas campestris]|uniref:DUF3800 domain-containing protein n=1 Tax=Xanthomonas campestris TaxID=339 RepID=UPI003CF47DCA